MYVFTFYVEIQNGHQKCRETHFLGKNCQMTADTLRGQTFR